MSRNLTGKHILIHIAISLYKKVVVLDEGGKFPKETVVLPQWQSVTGQLSITKIVTKLMFLVFALCQTRG